MCGKRHKDIFLLVYGEIKREREKNIIQNINSDYLQEWNNVAL